MTPPEVQRAAVNFALFVMYSMMQLAQHFTRIPASVFPPSHNPQPPAPSRLLSLPIHGANRSVLCSSIVPPPPQLAEHCGAASVSRGRRSCREVLLTSVVPCTHLALEEGVHLYASKTQETSVSRITWAFLIQ